MESERRFDLYEQHALDQLNKRILIDLKSHNWLTAKILNNDYKPNKQELGRLVPIHQAPLPVNHSTKIMKIAFLRM